MTDADIEYLTESDLYIHYHRYPLPDRIRRECTPLVRAIYDLLGISDWEHYEDEVFELHPDLDVDCDCGWDDLPEWKEIDELRNQPHCIHYNVEEFHRIYGHGLLLDREERKIYEQARERWFHELLQEKGMDMRKDRWEVIELMCNCDYYEREEIIFRKMVDRFGPGHRKDCILFQPQFIYKPTDLRIWWYKHPLRDATISQQLDAQTLTQILTECIRTVGGK